MKCVHCWSLVTDLDQLWTYDHELSMTGYSSLDWWLAAHGGQRPRMSRGPVDWQRSSRAAQKFSPDQRQILFPKTSLLVLCCWERSCSPSREMFKIQKS